MKHNYSIRFECGVRQLKLVSCYYGNYTNYIFIIAAFDT